MIKTIILGAQSDDAGELIRILAMHPDVELIGARAEGLDDRKVCRHHHGLIGETSLAFSNAVDFSRADVVFVCDNAISTADFNRLRHIRPDLRIICLDPVKDVDMDAAGVVYGLPEINRKLLVRGATAAFLPAPLASMALVALFPLALNLILSGDIDISVSVPDGILDKHGIEETEAEIERALREVQKSFSGSVSITPAKSNARRSALMEISFDCSVNREHLMEIYDIYDDHNFSFVVPYKVGVSEVAGTDKVVVTVPEPSDSRISLGVAADCRMRGGAGEAVHVMNLMFGLHERTGLALKAIDFNPVENNSDA